MFELIRSIRLDGDRATGTAHVDAGHPMLLDHFPGRPILPGTWLVELAAQIAGPLAEAVASARHGVDRCALLAMIDHAKLLAPVDLPATVRFDAEAVRSRAVDRADRRARAVRRGPRSARAARVRADRRAAGNRGGRARAARAARAVARVRRVEVASFGGVDKLRVADAAEPAPAAGEVVVDAHAWGVNYADLVQREGLYVGGPTPPFVPGAEAAGVVVAHGTGAIAPAIGARVIAVGRGLQAERVAVPAGCCVELPAGVDEVTGAAFAVSYLTAYHALVTVAHAHAGETVLIHAAAGGFGTAAVQIARRLGLRVVATASSEDKRARVRALGADTVVGYDAFEAAARGAAIVLDSIGGDVLRRSLAILAPLGRLVTIGATSGDARPIDALKLVYRSHAVLGVHHDAVLRRPDQLASSLAWLLPRVAAGELVPQIGCTMPLADVARAHALLASRASYGKIVLIR